MTDTDIPRDRGFSRRSFVAAAAITLALPAAARAAVKVTEKDVLVPTPDGTADAVLFHPAKGRGPWPAVLLWHDLGGLRPAYRDMGRRLAGEGFVVLVPNAFYRNARATGATLNMADPAVRARQMEYRTAATDDGIARDTIAYLALLDAQRQTARTKKAGSHGYDVGGSYAFRAAAALPDRIAAVGSFYGLGVATPRPNSPHLLVPKTKAEYLVAMSKDDDAREPDDKTDIAKVLAEGKLHGAVEVYPANHGWAVPGGPAYDAAATERGWQALVRLYKARLV
jgi:carboxymethylenebutenolidase